MGREHHLQVAIAIATSESQMPGPSSDCEGGTCKKISLRRQFGVVMALALVGAACTTSVEPRTASTEVPSQAVPALSSEAEADLRVALTADFSGLYGEPAPSGRMIDIELVAQRSEIELVDAGATEVWTYNGTVPGPQIDVPLGDTVWATLRNDLSNTTKR